MATLANSFPQNSSVAVIIPGAANQKSLSLTYAQLTEQCFQFQRKLAAIGIGRRSAVSIALPNSLEFIVRISLARP
jgi:acyl-CoA synthetase (AMP-forming)/AMP-acid ligase II